MKGGSDPWDDSALVEAFDQAMSKYKVMHGIDNVANSSNSEGLVRAEGITSRSTEATDPDSILDTAEQTCIPHNIGSTRDELPRIQENQPGHESGHPEQIPGATIYANSEGYDPNGYYQLLHQYYEIEGQRVKILQQLNQASYWNYQLPVQSSTNQANQATHSNGSDGGSFLQYSNQYFCQPELGDQEVSCRDSRIFGQASNNAEAVLETAVTEAERAISSLKLEASPGSLSHEDKERKKETRDTNASSVPQNVSSEVDLSCVLGAWYSAGFYTGRYIFEQSRKRGNH